MHIHCPTLLPLLLLLHNTAAESGGNSDICLGAPQMPLFSDAPLSEVLQEYVERFDESATLGTLRQKYAEYNAEKWRKAMAELGIREAVAKEAQQHVLWADVVDNFFRWKGVDLVTWEYLQKKDADDTKDKKRCHRAMRLLQGDVIHKLNTEEAQPGPHLLDELAAFMDKHPKWKDEGSYILYRDYDKLTNYPMAANIKAEDLAVTRVQHSGLCYMHAGAVMQHLVVALNSGGTHHEMLNVAKYIVQFYDARSVQYHIVDNIGGNSIGFMRGIMGLEETDITTKTLNEDDTLCYTARNVATNIRKLGLGLVATFKVEPAFQEDGLSFDGTLIGKSLGRHAMVVVGHREEDSKHHFLLQNWWTRKQFVEVSQEYLASSGASISFVTKAVNKIPDEYPKETGAYSLETEDLGDQFELEMRSYKRY